MNAIIQKLELGQGYLQVLIKDTINVQRSITQAGRQALADTSTAIQHAPVVSQILKHSCKIIGKTNLHALAFSITSINYFTDIPLNPNYLDLTSGGPSSSSAVALAEYICVFSIDTDTGGSILLPATDCGIYGLKPTFERISRDSVLPPQTSFDCAGTTANDIDVLIKVMQIINKVEKLRQKFTQEIDLFLEKLDVLILPTLPSIPPKLIDVQMPRLQFNLTALIRSFNLSGSPTLPIPLETTDHLPVGLQVIANHGQYEKLCLISKLLIEKFNSLTYQRII